MSNFLETRFFMIHLQRILFFTFSIFFMRTASASIFFSSYDNLLRPERPACKHAQITLFGEHSFKTRSFTEDGLEVNALSLWYPTQDALAMLNGFDASSAIGQLRIRVNASDYGDRGHFKPCGTLKFDSSGGFIARALLPYDLAIAAYMPFYSMSLQNVSWQDLTQMVTADDARTQTYLTSNIAAITQELGCLNIGPWKRSGAGDLTLLLEWSADFPQAKPFLRNVRLNGRLGGTFPTGRKADEDKILALPFGNDGSTSTIIGGGLDLTLLEIIKAGVDVELMKPFGNTKLRRIKTAPNQTELFLLAKTPAFREFSLWQRFNLYIEAFRMAGGLSFKAAYQFIHRDDDALFLLNNDFSQHIANTAKSLQEQTMHSIFAIFDYDFSVHLDENAPVIPYLSIYYRAPFNGKNSLLSDGLGALFTLTF